MKGTGGTSRSEEEKERREAFLPGFRGRRMQQSCKASGAARTCGLCYRQVAKDIWQGLVGKDTKFRVEGETEIINL